METIREYLENAFESPPIMGIAGVIIGIMFGLIIGWGIAPVEWTEAAIPHLREDLQVEYLRMSIDSYTQNQDENLAQTRWERLGENAPQILEKLEQDPGEMLVSDMDAFSNSATGEPAQLGEPEATENVDAETETTDTDGKGNWLRWGLLATAVLAGALVWRYLTNKGPRIDTPASSAQDFTEGLETTDYSSRGEVPPLQQFTTTYVLGDSLFDDSFGIESAAGEFLGECGIAVSESIGVGDPKRVTAFEVWLFDHDDITTITKVLTSSHAYYDESTLTELEKKGEPILAEPGQEFVLETKNLRIIARVMDMVYGEGPLPEESFFDRMALELSIWQNNQLDSFDEMEFNEF
ncbi:MAG: hypothetical protein U9O54_00610 [Chloroflexota bacterium]|nr:hypothetical protein [Chloroflexota bacterium]